MRILRNTKTLNLYRSLDTLKILTFWKIIQDKNILLLDKYYKENKKYSEKDLKKINDVWEKLYDEYHSLKNDSKSKAKLSKSFKELEVRNKIKEIKEYIDFLISLAKGSSMVDKEVITKYEQQVYANLKLLDKRIKPKLFEGIEVNIKYLSKFLNALINTYNRDNEDAKREVEKQISNVYEVVANAESWLAPQPIFINEMVVSHWIAIEKMIEKKQKAQQKDGKR